jgi:hypothetical protein
MINLYDTDLIPEDEPITQDEWAQIVREAIYQPAWRATADREIDYADGNQLASDLLERQRLLGIPPAKENIIGPAIRAVCGYEAKTRTDWRVTPDGDPQGQDIADAMNYKLNQAERHSGADKALSDAFKPAAAVGIGWIEVTRASNTIEFPYKCRAVNRNEIWWDMQGQEDDLSDCRWMYRRRWIDRQRAARMFPQHEQIILTSHDKWVGEVSGVLFDGGQSTGLQQAMDTERAWTVGEDHWYNIENQQVCITELWYRRWQTVVILRAHNGRTVEFDKSNPMHQAVLQAKRGVLEQQIIPRMRMAYFMGPHKLHDGQTPHPHDKFPYVRMIGYKEDMTGVPFGLVRDMIFPQDNLNASISKLRWGMASSRTVRTDGAVAMTDQMFRQMSSRVDADIILDAQHMALPGARFEVNRDFQLNSQQFQLMDDSRRAIERVSGVSSSFMGQKGTATSGVQEQTQLEQSQVSIADLMDNFKDARKLVGELLMALITHDMGEEEQTIVIEGDTINPERTIVLNKPEMNPHTGTPYMSNDVQRARLTVALEDVPSTSSFRAQQLNSLSETIKSMPPQLQQATMPFLIDLMDLPRKKQVVEVLRKASEQQSPEQIREQVKAELQMEVKMRELDLREREVAAREKLLAAQTVQTGVQASYSAMQAASQVAAIPQIAPVADVIMASAGYTRPNPMGDDPDFPQPVIPQTMPDVPQNTSPAFPPVPQMPESPMAGIETPQVVDNLI